MSKVIGVFILILLVAGAWELWSYYDKVDHDRDLAQKEAVAKTVVPEQLAGMPSALEPSYQTAQKTGPAAMKEWLRRNDLVLQDPRRAWIELEYMISISHDNPAEAKRIFAAVKGRTPEDSPVYSRIKQLEKTYE